MQFYINNIEKINDPAQIMHENDFVAPLVR